MAHYGALPQPLQPPEQAFLDPGLRHHRSRRPVRRVLRGDARGQRKRPQRHHPGPGPDDLLLLRTDRVRLRLVLPATACSAASATSCCGCCARCWAALGLFVVFLQTAADSWAPEFGSGSEVFGVGLVFVLGIGILALGRRVHADHGPAAARVLPRRNHPAGHPGPGGAGVKPCHGGPQPGSTTVGNATAASATARERRRRCPVPGHSGTGHRPLVSCPCPHAVSLRAAGHQKCATSMTSRDPEPGPSRVNTRNGSRARTPRPRVVYPS